MGLAAGMALIALALTVLGAILLRRGWRGRRVGDHPFCRHCEFDLFGREQFDICPECGGNLAVRPDVVVGELHRRWVSIGVGVLLFLIGFLPLTLIVWGKFQNVDWQQHKPLAWLLYEARSSDQANQTSALSELGRRLAAGTLSKPDITRIADAGLKAQADLSRNWNPAWGDWLEGAHVKGPLSAEQWKTYAQQAASTGWLSAEMQSKLHAGSTVTLRISGGNARVGKTSILACELRDLGVMLDGTNYPAPPSSGVNAQLLSSSGQIFTTQQPNDSITEAAKTLLLGEHKGYLRIRAKVTELNAPMSGSFFGSRGGGGFGGSSLASATIVFPGGMNPPIASPAPAPAPPPSMTLIPPPTLNDPSAVQQWFAQQRAAQTAAQSQILAQLNARRAGAVTIGGGSSSGRVFTSNAAISSAILGGKPTGADFELHVPVRFATVDPAAPVIRPVKDEKFRQAVEGGLVVDRLMAIDTNVRLTVRTQPPPVDLSYRVLLRQGEKEWPVGSFAARKNEPSPMMALGTMVTEPLDLEGKTVDVVFRPDGGEAGAQTGANQYWDSEVVLKDMPLNNAVYSSAARRMTQVVPRSILRQSVDEAPSTMPATPAPEVTGPIAQLGKMQVQMREKLLGVPGEDWARYQDFLKQPDTGLIKLLPRGKYQDTVVGIREAGAYYSFTRKTHEYGYGSDIELNEQSRFQVGFAGGDYGYFLPLGDVPIEKVAATSSSVPAWASADVKEGWNAMWSSTPLNSSAARSLDQYAIASPGGRAGVSAEPGRSYLLRSVSSDADTLIGLRVVRKFSDGSVVIVYKVLNQTSKSARGRLPTTRVP